VLSRMTKNSQVGTIAQRPTGTAIREVNDATAGGALFRRPLVLVQAR
jgi:hypothetical protein